MKGNEEVLTLLNDLLTNELTAINQYFIHAKMCENWGYERLAKKIRDESIDEMKHADMVISADPVPRGRAQPAAATTSCTSARPSREQLESDLQLEYAAIAFLNHGIEPRATPATTAREELLEKILVSEEEHTDWLETQLELIRQVGEQNYLAQQMRE